MNKIKFFLQTILITVIHTVINGSVLQTFMLEKSISEDSVGLYFSVMQIVQIVIMLFFSKWVDKQKNVIKASAYTYFMYIPFILILMSLCVFDFDGMFLLILLFGFIANISIGLYSILTYKLPYHIMDMKNYGSWCGIAGLLSGVFTFVFSLLMTFLQKHFSYLPTMKYIYAVALAANCVLAAVAFSFKRVENNVTLSKDRGKISLLKYKPFTFLIVPNILRGFCLGIVSLAVTIGYFTELLDSFSASILLIVTQVATILGCFVYTCLAGKEKFMLLFCSAGVLVTLPLMIMKNTTAFLVFYGIAYFFITIINYAVPTAVVRLIDYEVSGQYNGGRMLLNTVGVFLASFLCGTLLKTLGAFSTLAVAGAAQLISGIIYFWYLKKKKI